MCHDKFYHNLRGRDCLYYVNATNRILCRPRRFCPSPISLLLSGEGQGGEARCGQELQFSTVVSHHSPSP